ncbi:MAG TPA: iron ABC transporter permease [Thermotogota bacterium]|nr:iron ABC transporter permease [Thermotogota bacterium]HPJ87654.1 iron ABC transporter permease [Thermotogota bacterium]HPR94908.1 iron ABC transporter permease [Thermotogota bacterium]
MINEKPSTIFAMKRGGIFPLLFVALLFIIFLFINLSIGTVRIPFDEIIRFFTFREIKDPVYKTILFDIRLPRILLGIFSGAILAVAGNMFQALLRNPLADPYILGVSSGASFGTVLTIALFGVGGVLPPIFYNLPLMSFFFALLVAFSTYFIARKGGKIPVVDLILSGVIMNFLFSAGTTFIIVYGWRNVQHASFWLMGSLSGATWENVCSMAVVSLLGTGAGIFLSTSLNAISLGEEEAMNIGVNVERLKIVVFVLGTLMTAYTVTATGLVGFVGLIMPHTARLITGPNHRISIPVSAVLGGLFLTTCDTIARSAFQPSEMPLGTITAIVGAPVFIYLMRKSKTR